MANLQDLFKDYLVSYSSTPVPESQEVFEFPETNYDRLLAYNANKPKEDNKKEEPEETPQNTPIFTQWSYYFDEPTSERTDRKQ